ncbi:MAG: hypothetical protein BGP12_02500 [Rhodospirillales bacterium 70-18]|nr:hypothetical protein [Rhodospirillales bacterium]OJY77417.1 MAG: hypothetical protein BGP12_02500 [Rhodospirillales bacterium 70-18]
MRAPYILFALLAAPVAAFAAGKTAPPAAAGPKAIGTFGDWQAATYPEGGQTVCYAFARAKTSAPALPGRGPVMLTVTQRASGRDAVSLSAGFAYAPNAGVKVAAEAVELDFYTAQRSAFARDGHAAVLAFEKANQAVAHSPGPKGQAVTDTFSLRGFTAAYGAINKACPAK